MNDGPVIMEKPPLTFHENNMADIATQGVSAMYILT